MPGLSSAASPARTFLVIFISGETTLRPDCEVAMLCSLQGGSTPSFATILGAYAASLCALCAMASIAAHATILGTSESNNITLSDHPTRIALLDSGGRKLEAGRVEIRQERPIYLVVDGLSAQFSAGTSYRVFLGLPEGVAPTNDEPGYAGTLSFFDVPTRGAESESSVSFDVTAAVARLGAAGHWAGPLTVTLVPDGPPAEGSDPALRQLRLIVP